MVCLFLSSSQAGGLHTTAQAFTYDSLRREAYTRLDTDTPTLGHALSPAEQVSKPIACIVYTILLLHVPAYVYAIHCVAGVKTHTKSKRRVARDPSGPAVNCGRLFSVV